MVAPLAIDPMGEVRQAALQCLDLFAKCLKDADAKRSAENTAAVAASGGTVGNGGVSGSGGGAAGLAGAAPTIGEHSSFRM